jgi:hypothetical protein
MTNSAAVPNLGVLSPRSLAFATVGAAARPEVTICALPNVKTRKTATWAGEPSAIETPAALAGGLRTDAKGLDHLRAVPSNPALYP